MALHRPRTLQALIKEHIGIDPLDLVPRIEVLSIPLNALKHTSEAESTEFEACTRATSTLKVQTNVEQEV